MRGEPEASRRLLTCCHRAGEAGLKSMVSISLRSVHEIMRAIGQVLWLFNCWTFWVSFVVYTDSFVRSTWASVSLRREADLCTEVQHLK